MIGRLDAEKESREKRFGDDTPAINFQLMEEVYIIVPFPSSPPIPLPYHLPAR